MYRTHDENAPERLAEAGPAVPDGLVADEVVELVADAIHNTEQRADRKIGAAMESARAEWQLRLERELSSLRAENAELRGFLGGLLTVYGSRPPEDVPKGQIIDLPVPWRRRDGA